MSNGLPEISDQHDPDYDAMNKEGSDSPSDSESDSGMDLMAELDSSSDERPYIDHHDESSSDSSDNDDSLAKDAQMIFHGDTCTAFAHDMKLNSFYCRRRT